jgi:predicted nucleic acid-binding Zn ribbon protein
MSNYNYFCETHGEIILNLPFGQAHDKERCPLCDKEIERIYSNVATIWKCSGAFGKSNS